MTKPVAIVDIFSGPGGLAEGFVPCYKRERPQRYHVALSIEKEPAAYETLRLRAFLRKFGNRFPKEYYDFLNAKTSEPNWARLYPKQWEAATKETLKLEISGKRANAAVLKKHIKEIRSRHESTMLIGGPPCQAYSLAGRSRIAREKLQQDGRLILYKQYVKVLKELQPAVAVMENVKGLLSSKVGERGIFAQVSRALRHAGYRNNYRLFALAPSSGNCVAENDLEPRDFVVRAEDYGIPQSRHRVFIICLRQDIAKELPAELYPNLMKKAQKVSVNDTLMDMPKLRSGLSKNDNPIAWQKAVRNACQTISKNSSALPYGGKRKFLSAIARVRKILTGSVVLPRSALGGVMLPPSCPRYLQDWLQDKNLAQLPNNDTRGHMAADLARYIFAAVYGDVFGYSPKTTNFPRELAPNHKNWKSGDFSDRYRVQLARHPSSTITSHISKDGHYFIHPDAVQCRSLTVREAARLQTFPDNYFFKGNRTEQYVQVGNAVPPFLAHQIAQSIWPIFVATSRRRSR